MTTPEAELPKRAAGDAERCPTCDAQVPQGFRFCGQCGRALGVSLAAAGGPVTIAFADLDGFTSFASRRGDEQVHELLLNFHRLVREHVGRHGGFEVKQLGDALMVAFPSPRRGVACAVDIQRAAARDVWPSLRIAIGINSGDAIRDGDDFFGHTVNVASRITARASGGQVLVSGATRRLAGDVPGVRFVDYGRRQLRGLRSRYRLYEARWGE